MGKTPKTYWNYRVGTYMWHPTESMGDIKSRRLYKIIECHYENDKPASYGDSKVLSDWEDMEDIKYTYKKIKGAFKKNILDLDNWPNKYKPL